MPTAKIVSTIWSEHWSLILAFPQIFKHFSDCSLTLTLELMGAQLIEMLVAPDSIVENLDVIEDF